MQLKFFSLAALLGAAGAQELQNLSGTLAGTPMLSNLTTFLGQFPDLLHSLASATNVTILAPSNEALTNLLNSSAGLTLATNPGLVQAVLQYHVIDGVYHASDFGNTTSFFPTLLTNSSYANVTGGQRVEVAVIDDKVTLFSGLLQNSTVVQGDLNFTGGTIHIIDTVLSLPQNISSSALAANLTALYGALKDTNLVSTVDELHDVTVFAPINDAFQSIGSALQNASVDDLSKVLTYHVINGTIGHSSDLTNGTVLQTVGGGNLTVRIENGTVFVNSAKVVVPNVLVANGVVHVIDNVLNPENTSAAPSVSATAGSPAFTGSSVSGVPFTSGVPTPTSSVATNAGPPAGGATTTTTSGGAMPMKTGVVAPAMLFGGAAVVMMNM